MKIIDREQAAALVQDGWTIASAGFVGVGHAEALSSALEERFLATGHPRDLTLLYAAGQGDRATRGTGRFGHEGLRGAGMHDFSSMGFGDIFSMFEDRMPTSFGS